MQKNTEGEKDYLMSNDPDEDGNSEIVSIEIPDELIDELEDESKVLEAILMHDPDRFENPRRWLLNFDYYAAWSMIAKTQERRKQR